jgi:hypothetical protein
MTKKWLAVAAMPLYKKLPVVIALSLGIWLASCGTSPRPEFITVPKSRLNVPAQITGLVRIANLDDAKCPVKEIDGEPIVYTGGHAVHDKFIKRGQEYPMPRLGDSWLGISPGKHAIVSKYASLDYSQDTYHRGFYESKDFLSLEFEAIANHQYFVACSVDPGTMTWTLAIYDCTNVWAYSHDDWLKQSKRVATTVSSTGK